jgi:hypothetical protein
MLMCRHPNTDKIIKKKKTVMNSSRCGIVKTFRKTVRNQNLIYNESKRELNSRNACYHSVRNILSSHLLFKNVKL